MSHLKVNIGGFVLRRVIIISLLVRKSDECSWYLDLKRVASSFLVKLSRRRKYDTHSLDFIRYPIDVYCIDRFFFSIYY